MKRYQVTYYHSVDKKLKSEWEKLWSSATNANIFNSYDWFHMCLQEQKGLKVRIVACYEQEELVALFPMTTSKTYGIPVWVPVGDAFVVDTTFLFLRYDSELLKTFFEALLSQGNLYITTLDAGIVARAHELFPKLFFSLISVNPYIDLTQPDPLRFVSHSNKRNIEKILKKCGDELRFEERTAENADLTAEFRIAIEIEQHSTKKMQKKDIFKQKENVRFYQSMIKYAGRFVRIYTVYFKDVPFVYGFCLTDGKKMIGYQTSFLSQYRHLSPGKIMIVKLLTYLQQKGYSLFDFGGGISSYKQEFTPDYFFQYNLYFSKNPLIMMWWKTINFARRLKQQTRPVKFTRDHEFLFRTV